jgi:RsiW-degrading membrane proteinase PrsW (M82 family)
MEAFYLLVAKPLWYALAFVLAAHAFAEHGPHWRWPQWLVVILATAGRLAAGFLSLLLASALVQLDHPAHVVPGVALIALFGFLLWWGVARVAFRRTPMEKLLLFALLAELASGTVDALLIHQVAHINIC